MTSDPRKNSLRLRKRHEPDPEPPPDHLVGQRLWDAQSISKAVLAGLIAILVFTLLWSMVSTLLGRVFPWATILLGVLIGFTVRRAGLGLSWPFPAAAAMLALLGSLVSSLWVAAVMVAEELDTAAIAVLFDPASSWGGFAAEVLTAGDFVFAISAAGVAAFYSMRRLSRREYLAFRLWNQARAN